ncbi:MAG: hypothetical protein AAB405_01520 [Patescibacteria group bacterium]
MKMEDRIIKSQKSVIIATDVEIKKLSNLIDATMNVPGISGYKIGFNLGLQGLYSATFRIKGSCKDKKFEPVIIYDHQKAGNDIPEMGKNFAKILKDAGVDAAILFPFAGPKTQQKWTEECLNAGLKVIIGGIMTHEQFLVSEGGYIADDAPESIFILAAKMGVRHFVVPGTKINWIIKLRGILDNLLGPDEYALYAPGFISQGGTITECGRAAGKNWHVIVGSAIYNQPTVEKMREAAMLTVSQLVNA